MEPSYKMIRNIIIVVVILLCVFIFNPFGTIGAGERGIRLRFNAVVGDPIPEGLYLKIPLVDHIEIMDVKIQKEEVTATAASKDLQEVSSIVALNFHIRPSDVNKIYQEVGIDYADVIITPAIQEAVKASTAQFTAEELITRRSEVKDKIQTLLKQKIEEVGIGIIVDAFNIVDLDFSKSFNLAIEAKATAEQDALAAKNKLEQVKFEAEQKIAKATADAESIRIQALAITQQGGKDYVNLQWIDAWKEGGAKVPEIIVGEGGANFLYNLNK